MPLQGLFERPELLKDWYKESDRLSRTSAGIHSDVLVSTQKWYSCLLHRGCVREVESAQNLQDLRGDARQALEACATRGHIEICSRGPRAAAAAQRGQAASLCCPVE